MAAVAGIGDDTGEAGADLRLDGGNEFAQCMAIIRIAGQCRDMGDELAALAAVDRGGDADLDAELIGAVCLALADAFDLGGMERIDFGAGLTALLAMDAPGEMQRSGEVALELGTSFDLALDVADDGTEIGSQRAQRLIGAVELMGMGVTLMLDQRMFADPRVSTQRASSPLTSRHIGIGSWVANRQRLESGAQYKKSAQCGIPTVYGKKDGVI
ncbi:hypothetical protein SPH9361_04196 [Sphingobium sp. CECT 9361]|nr:hypothetical protein SPH9361_04196 [Sphingobium sp. CECT 9361]